MKILLVKQEIFPDLYCCKFGLSPLETFKASLFRSGPAAWLADGADFAIVKYSQYENSDTWREKPSFCKQESVDWFLKFPYGPIVEPYLGRGHKVPQHEYALDFDQINWEQYDCVISYEPFIPKEIVLAHPNVLWGYFLPEHGPSEIASHIKPLHNYDVYLNLKNEKLVDAPHEITCPYNVQYYGCFEKLGFQSVKLENKDLIACCHHSRSFHNQKIGNYTIKIPMGSIGHVIETLMRSKYFIKNDSWHVWGNSVIEAIAAGCLVLANPQEITHSWHLIDQHTTIKSFEEIKNRILYLEENPTVYDTLVRRQRARVAYHCYFRPMQQLTHALMVKRKANGHIK